MCNRQASLLAFLTFACLVNLITPRRGDSHDPITTKITFNKEILRIFQRHCLACHDSRNVTNVQLANYALARPWAKAFKEEVLEKRMPPFQSVKGFGNFHDDYSLTQREIDQIVSWVEGGVPKGDDKDLPSPLIVDGWAGGQPNLVLKPEHEVRIAAGEGDEYRCVPFTTNLNEDRWVTGMEFHPGNSAAVHCASVEIDPLPKRGSGAHAVACGGVRRSTTEVLGNWIPGQTASRWPAHMGRRLPAGARLLMRIHYQKSSTPIVDQSEVGLYLAKDRSTRSVRTVALDAPDTAIPAGADQFRVKAYYTLSAAAAAVAIRPLLFPFARSIEVTAHRPDGGREVLIWARDYRYDWQPEYSFKQPVSLPKGTRVEVIAYLDNSDKNLNNPNHPVCAIRFAATLCELSLVNTK